MLRRGIGVMHSRGYALQRKEIEASYIWGNHRTPETVVPAPWRSGSATAQRSTQSTEQSQTMAGGGRGLFLMILTRLHCKVRLN
jgi:hypothetical protein